MKRLNFYKLTLLVLTITVFLISPLKGDTKKIPDTINITGNPAPPSHIRYVLSNYLSKNGFSLKILSNLNIKRLKPGKSLTLNLPLISLNNNKNTITKKIIIKNIDIPYISPVLLAFSNHPEKIKSPGLLYEVGLLKNKPIRLRYYHLGDKKAPPHYLGIFLVNIGDKEAKLQITEAIGGPSKNWIYAGHMNNYKFFHSLKNRLSWIETIPPKSTYLLRRSYIKPNEVISATADINLLSGSPLRLLVYAYKNHNDEISHLLKNDKKDRHERGAYPLTKIKTNISFSLLDDEAFFTIGDTPFSNIFKGRSIRGSYGIMYQYNITLKNPYPKDKYVSFFFQPRGGVATATFSFDDKPISISQTKAYSLARLARIKVPAKSTKNITVKTMPEDASNYPVRMILKTDAP